MPLDPVSERRPPITPQLAVRVAGLGVLALILFGVVFFRLWYLQVLDGDKYLAQARDNRVRTERIEAPRGQIKDANNVTLVDNRKAIVVSLDPRTIPTEMRTAAAEWGQQMTARAKRKKGHRGPPPALPQPPAGLRTRYRRLGHVLQLSPTEINRRVVRSIIQVPYGNVRLKIDVTRPERDYIEERGEQFPGVRVEQLYVRSYPYKDQAAQLFGTVGEISPKQLEDKAYKGIRPGTEIGQNGLEAAYDKFLRGTDGTYRIEVNAAGERRGSATGRDPQQGQLLKLTLDQGLQQIGEQALKRAGASAAEDHGGAFVAMNPQTGAIYAMGSIPTFDAGKLNSFHGTQQQYEAEFGEAGGSPQFNRAIAGAYPTGSIFKPITALAAMDAGVMSPSDTFNDTGCLKIGARQADVACNAGDEANGTVDLMRALQVSSDTYFYNLGLKLYAKPKQYLQEWARRMGLGHRTGIDIPNESSGTIPGPSWVRRINAWELACRKRRKVATCGYSGDAVWNPGNETQTAVGQGDVQATPLQMAVAYSTLVTDGKVPTPHLAQQVEDSRGLVQRLDPPAARRVDIDDAARSAIMEGLRRAANEDGGTSKQVWEDGWPRDRFPIWGKTGTAERPPHPDQSWYALYSYDARHPDENPIVIVATVEGGGFGAEAAAPAARLILSKWFNQPLKWVAGDSRTR